MEAESQKYSTFSPGALYNRTFQKGAVQHGPNHFLFKEVHVNSYLSTTSLKELILYSNFIHERKTQRSLAPENRTRGKMIWESNSDLTQKEILATIL